MISNLSQFVVIFRSSVSIAAKAFFVLAKLRSCAFIEQSNNSLRLYSMLRNSLESRSAP